MEGSPEPSQQFILQSIISNDAINVPNGLLITAVLLLIIGSALISGSEVAFFSFKADHLEQFKSSKKKTEQLIANLLSEPRKLLATVLIANNFFNVGIIILSSYLLSQLFDFSIIQDKLWRSAAEFTLKVVLVTFLIVLFGEIIPKIYATQKARVLARFMAKPLTITQKLLLPFSSLLTKTTERLEMKWAAKNQSISADEMDLAIDLTTTHNSTQEEVQMLKSIVRFGDISVKDVMTSRPDIKAFQTTLSFHDLIDAVRETGFSRVPVYEEDLDKVIGVLYAKDLLSDLHQSDNFHWRSLVREPYFVPENKKIDDLLKDFQANRLHIAIVVDEYGGTAGLITLEDILEEIIGDIKDEFDDVAEDIYYEKISDNEYIFEGKVSLFDMCKIIDTDFQQFEEAKGESDSLAGLVLELTGIIPKQMQKISFENYTFTILEADKKRIKKIKLERKFEL